MLNSRTANTQGEENAFPPNARNTPITVTVPLGSVYIKNSIPLVLESVDPKYLPVTDPVLLAEGWVCWSGPEDIPEVYCR